MSNQRINEIYSVAMDNGAIGGKILGSEMEVLFAICAN